VAGGGGLLRIELVVAAAVDSLRERERERENEEGQTERERERERERLDAMHERYA